jgi:hypothetical protein
MQRLQSDKYESLHDAIRFYDLSVANVTKLVVESKAPTQLRDDTSAEDKVMHEGSLYSKTVISLTFPNNILRLLLTKNEQQCVSFVKRHVASYYFIKSVTSET